MKRDIKQGESDFDHKDRWENKISKGIRIILWRIEGRAERHQKWLYNKLKKVSKESYFEEEKDNEEVKLLKYRIKVIDSIVQGFWHIRNPGGMMYRSRGINASIRAEVIDMIEDLDRSGWGEDPKIYKIYLDLKSVAKAF